MLTHLLLLVLAVALGAMASPVRAQSRDSRAVRQELEAKYAKIAQAYRDKDIHAFMENKTPDFTARSLDGRIATREQIEDGVKKRMGRIVRLNYLKIRIKELTVRGGEAVAITTQEFSRVITGQQGREHTVVSKGTTHRDTWVKTETGWALKSVEELAQGEELVDGRRTSGRR